MLSISTSGAVALLLLLASTGVQASSQLWEEGIRLQAPHPVERIEVDEAGYAITDNSTAAERRKRWVALIPAAGTSESKRWPDRTISYCYESQEARDKLYRYLKDARDKWQHAGLNTLVYKYQQVAEPGRDCTNNPQRAKILVVQYNDQGRLGSTLGMPALDGDTPEYKGPYMMLSDRDDVGMLNVAANVAHELGHVWGLGHEHQNPYFWLGPGFGVDANLAMPNGMNTGDNPPFDKPHFNCRALKDYQSVHDYVGINAPGDVPDLCVKHSIAAKHKFSAMEWLPDISGNLRRQVTSPFATSNNIDWLSIMLYPSGAGGIGDAAPPGQGEPIGTNDHREHVLVLAGNGNNWHGNYDPSEDDIRGVRFIYEDNNFPDGEPVLISDPSNKFNSKFRSAIGRAKCRIIEDD